MSARERERRPLPSKASAGQVIAGILAGVEHLVTNRPRPVAEIQEQHRDRWNAADGLTVEGLDDPIERPDRPDRTGARV
jgi:antitoxin (DNA-binding transcriptional repressor) of toxin-antitoxin stability system